MRDHLMGFPSASHVEAMERESAEYDLGHPPMPWWRLLDPYEQERARYPFGVPERVEYAKRKGLEEFLDAIVMTREQQRFNTGNHCFPDGTAEPTAKELRDVALLRAKLEARHEELHRSQDKQMSLQQYFGVPGPADQLREAQCDVALAFDAPCPFGAGVSPSSK